jgi:hypothetical protein
VATKKKSAAKTKTQSKPKAEPKRTPSSMEDFGAKVGRTIGEASNRVEQESERLVSYVNDQLVPAIRGESTSALRKAAEKLKVFADYLDDQKRKQKGS